MRSWRFPTADHDPRFPTALSNPCECSSLPRSASRLRLLSPAGPQPPAFRHPPQTPYTPLRASTSCQCVSEIAAALVFSPIDPSPAIRRLRGSVQARIERPELVLPISFSRCSRARSRRPIRYSLNALFYVRNGRCTELLADADGRLRERQSRPSALQPTLPLAPYRLHLPTKNRPINLKMAAGDWPVFNDSDDLRWSDPAGFRIRASCGIAVTQ
jgi:hypothetical protein